VSADLKKRSHLECRKALTVEKQRTKCLFRDTGPIQAPRLGHANRFVAISPTSFISFRRETLGIGGRAASALATGVKGDRSGTFEDRRGEAKERASARPRSDERCAGRLHFFAKESHAARPVARHGEGYRGVIAAAAPGSVTRLDCKTSQR
jgi:hypothetical protein